MSAAASVAADVDPVVVAAPRARRLVGEATWLVVLLALAGLESRVAAHPDGLVLWAPSIGVALLWLVRSPAGAGRWARGLTVMVVAALAAATVGAPGAVALLEAGVSGGVALGGAWALERWVPALVGDLRRGRPHDLRSLAHGLVCIVAVSALTSAAAALLAALLIPGAPGGGFGFLLSRTAGGALLAAPLGHLLLERVPVAPHDQRRGARYAGRCERAALAVVSVAVYAAVFDVQGLPVAFVVLPLGVWAGLRLPTAWAGVHVLAGALVAATMTLTGRGPFSAVPGTEARVMVLQAFLLVVMLTTLALAVSRDSQQELRHALHEALEEARSRAALLDATTDAMTEGVVVLDVEGRVLRMNPSARALLSGATGAGAQTQDYEVTDAQGNRLPVSQHPSRRALVEGVVAAHDIGVRFRDGSLRLLSVTAAPVRSGADARTGSAPLAGAVSVYRDVTDERAHSQRLADFAATVAHDLRSPLASTQGWLDLAATLVDDLDDGEEVAMAVGRAGVATTRLTELVAELLRQSTAEGGVMVSEVVDLSGPRGVVDLALETLAAPGLVDGPPLLPVLGDPELIRQLFTNLLANAVKYVAEGVTPRVRVTTRLDGDRVVVEVVDNGIGVPANAVDRVFEKFHRAHAGDASYAGTGLGLALVRTIVQRHGGLVECRPNGRLGADDGTTFVFDLPAVAA